MSFERREKRSFSAGQRDSAVLFFVRFHSFQAITLFFPPQLPRFQPI
jgi:hypothetical protein